LKVAILADTHLPKGARRLPEACLREVAGSTALIHAGDFWALPVLRELEAIGPPLHAVHGNVDEPAVRDALPSELTLELDGVRIAVVHDAGPKGGRLARMRRRFPEAAAVVFGHSHMPLLEAEGGFQIFNPGSPTERRRAPRHSMGVLDFPGGAPRFRHVWLGA